MIQRHFLLRCEKHRHAPSVARRIAMRLDDLGNPFGDAEVQILVQIHARPVEDRDFSAQQGLEIVLASRDRKLAQMVNPSF
jgi:hypothetical protein